MAAASCLTRPLAPGAFAYRGCLRTRSLQGHGQRRWVGQKYLAKAVKADQEWQAQAQRIKDGKKKNLFDELDERGFIKDVVGSNKDELREIMRVKRVKAYAGVDPTATSLHLGHLVTFMPLFWMYLHGYGGMTLVGTATAKIGDPTGRTKSRPEMNSAQLVQNMTGIQHQLKAIWQNVEAGGRRFGFRYDWAWERAIVMNGTWWNKAPMLDIMKRLGRYVRIGPMLGRDTVKTRLDKGVGMSFSEFAYPLMQGWDWYELYKQRGVQMQIGGSDQYGNILMGIECVKQCVKNEPAIGEKLPDGEMDQRVGFTVPLLTDGSGRKFGKSAGNAIWLDPFMTSPYDMYGYLMRRSDEEVERLLKLLTFQPQEEIKRVMAEHDQDRRQRVAQRLLADEVVRLVHGLPIATSTAAQHQAVYGANSEAVHVPSAAPIAQSPEQYELSNPKHPVTATNAPRVDLKLPVSLLSQSLARILYAAGLAVSVGDADRSIKQGGIYIGGSPGAKGLKYQFGMTPELLSFTPQRFWEPGMAEKFLIDGKIMILRKGKHNLRCVEFISDNEFTLLELEYPGMPLQGAFRKAMSLLKAQTAAARAKKQENNGFLAMEDQIANSSFGAEANTKIPQEQQLKRHRKKMAELREEGLVKDDPYAW